MVQMFIVWNGAKNEAVLFDNALDACETSTGEFTSPSSSIGEDFFGHYGEDAPLAIQVIDIDI